MRARGVLVLALVLSLALVPVLVSLPVRAQTQYTERVDVYTAGSNAYWLMTLDRLNSSVPNLGSAELSAGINAYRLLAVNTQSATSDFQVFGVDGYNVLKVPSLPSQGLFLTVNASSSAAASPLVSFFATRFGTTFTLVASATGSYVFFAPVSFSGVALPVLFRLVPTAMNGFASFVTETTFSTLPFPSIALSGIYNGTGFSHSITIGSAVASAVSSTGLVSIQEVLGNANGTLTASSSSSSSIVEVHAMDGIVQSSDKATISNDLSSFSGSYTLSTNPGSAVRANVTVTSQAPTAIAYRVFDHGALLTGQSLAVTVFVKNTAEAGTIQNVTLNDNWYLSYPSVFQLSSGNSSFTIPRIAAGQNATESYVLKVAGTAGESVSVPSNTVSFEYLIASTSFSGSATLNQAVLQVNNVGPSMTITARPTISSGVPLGTAGNYTLVLTNSGNSPALDIKVGGKVITNLAQGSSQTVQVPMTLSGLSQRSFTESFSLEFTDATQQTQNVTSNSVSLLLSHSGMVIPFVQLATNDTLTATSLSSRSLDVTYSFVNKGTANAGMVAAIQPLPSGVSCKLVSGIGTCGTGPYTAAVSKLAAQGSMTNKIELAVPNDNLIILPTSIATSYEGATLHTFGGTYVIPAGIVITKSFGLTTGFPGMVTSVSLGITNSGSSPVYNATLSSSQDNFDTIAGGATTSSTYASLSSQQSQSFNYTVTFSNTASGNASSPASVSLVFGGLTTSFTSSPTQVEIFKPVAAVILANPSTPEENHDFTLTITFKNAASVAVNEATYSFTIPSGLSVVSGAQLSGRTVTVSAPSIGPDSNQSVVVTLTASTGLTIDTTSSHLTFQYQGASLSGIAPKQTITVGEDVTTRYTLPIILAIFIALAGLVYMRRRINPAVKA